MKTYFTVLLSFTLLNAFIPVYAGEGVTNKEIRIAGVMDLKGRSKGLGNGMKKGIEAALRNKKIKGRKITFIALNDSYTPEKTIASTEDLIQQNILLFAGNVGTPTAKVSLPILARNKIPAVGFFTGAGLLRPGKGPIINYRASYVQETKKVIEKALSQGVAAPEICAYVQNDAYGMAGVEGIRRALQNKENSQASLKKINKVLAMKGVNPPRNGVGSIGVYQRNSYLARDGYLSLKAWEKRQGVHCKLVVTVGAYTSIAKFIGYASYKGEDWTYSAVSFTGAENFRTALKEVGVTQKVIMTQVVPLLDNDLDIIGEAKSVLRNDFGYVTLEGYIVGKIILKGLQGITGQINRKNFMKAIKGHRFNIGGLKLDFTDDNQGSDLVMMTALVNGEWEAMSSSISRKWF